MSSHSPAATAPPRLIAGVLIFALSLAAALVFAKAFEEVPAFVGDPSICGEPADPEESTADPHAAHSKKKPDPIYYVGGLWSDTHGMPATLDLAMRSANAGKPIVCQSARSNDGKTLTIIDNSPIQFDKAAPQDTKPILILSIDHAGSAISEEYPAASAVQKYITAQLDTYSSILVVEPLPGPKTDTDKEWTYLNFSSDERVEFFEPKRLDDVAETVQPLYELLRGDTPLEANSVAKLIEQLGSKDPSQAADAGWLLSKHSPYEVIPALEAWVTAAEGKARGKRIYEAIMIRRALGVHADDLTTEAAASDATAMRALAARALGDLADVTTDPIGKLTPLAEDDEMSVRYEALASCLAMPGRRAAGVAQLVAPYEMTDMMRSAYQSVLAELLTYGEPIQADSRANRLRRMPIAALLKQDRGALVCRILLESTDLPDNKIDEVLGQLATLNGRGPLTELFDLLTTINPSTLAKREVLLKKFVSWKPNELLAQTPRLKEIALGNGMPNLRNAAAAAMAMSSEPKAVLAELGDRPVVYESLAWVTDQAVLKRWVDAAMQQAQKATPLDTSVAAVDAIKSLPPDSVTNDHAAMLLGLAKQADSTDLRFAAIRAINALPVSLKPAGSEDLKLTQLEITAVTGMKYDKTILTVTAGRPIELTLINPDTMEHNLVITLPGRATEIGFAMSRDANAAAAIGYVPQDSDAVLFYTEMLRSGERTTLRFFAPPKPGSYEYVCTFPGHYNSMRGVLEVVAP